MVYLYASATILVLALGFLFNVPSGWFFLQRNIPGYNLGFSSPHGTSETRCFSKRGKLPLFGRFNHSGKKYLYYMGIFTF